MKRVDNFLIVIVGLFIVFGCQGQGGEFKTEEEEATERIKQGGYQYRNDYRYSFKFGEPDEDSKKLEYKTEYDRQGKAISRTYKINDLSSYTFNKGYQKIEETVKYEYEEDKENNTVKITERYLDGSIRQLFIRKVDKQNRSGEEIRYDADGNFIGKDEFSYDKNGVITDFKSFNKEGKLSSHRVIDPNSPPESPVSIWTFGITTTRITEKKINEYITRYDWIEEDSEDSFYYITKNNEDGLVVEVTTYSMSGIPKEMTRSEWIKFEDNPQ